MAQEVEATIQGGKASAGPPLGPALGAAGLNTQAVLADINEKTKDFAGMQVPIVVVIEDDKSYTIKIGAPPATGLIKSVLGIQKGSGNARTDFVKDMSIEDLKKLAGMKRGDLTASSFRQACAEIVGTCTSMGITVDGKNPREMSKAIRAGEYDDVLVE